MARKHDIETLQEAQAALVEHGSYRRAAAALGIPASTMQARIGLARIRLADKPAEFEAPALPSGEEPIDELIAGRLKAYARKREAHDARKLIPVHVKLDGPIGILHQGDPHLDDDGCNWPVLMRHVEIARSTPGMLVGQVGDYTNNWIGRLGRLYGEQSTTAAQGWKLAEWYVSNLPLLYMIGGNHDAWSGSGDPLKWIAAQAGNQYEMHGARLGLNLPNGKQIRINARHDHKGSSVWNPNHGPSKAAQIGPEDHIYVSGHRHVFGQGWHRRPSGLWSCALRVGTYKDVDNYAAEGGFQEHNIPAVCTLIFPDANEEGLIEVVKDVERAADFLTWARARHASGRSVTAKMAA